MNLAGRSATLHVSRRILCIRATFHRLHKSLRLTHPTTIQECPSELVHQMHTPQLERTTTLPTTCRSNSTIVHNSSISHLPLDHRTKILMINMPIQNRSRTITSMGRIRERFRGTLTMLVTSQTVSMLLLTITTTLMAGGTHLACLIFPSVLARVIALPTLILTSMLILQPLPKSPPMIRFKPVTTTKTKIPTIAKAPTSVKLPLSMHTPACLPVAVPNRLQPQPMPNVLFRPSLPSCVFRKRDVRELRSNWERRARME
mmetsp:Transcript_15732/g.33983  ORF Transcript_15732/g.33983 Transcript_15732/m.33983 type:complete len:259 (+) Transcript_15732:455-1231(+)